MKQLLILSMLSVLFASCVKDRTQLINDANSSGANVGPLLINEYMAKETKAPSLNELGMPADWMEIYNNGPDTLHLVYGKWFVTDNFANKGEFLLPTMTMAPAQHLVVWCDHGDTVPGLHDIHANFALSSKGEEIGLYYLSTSGTDTLPYDKRVFGLQADDISEGRITDGSNTWTTFTNPTPGTTNH